MAEKHLLSAIFARYGVAISDEEASAETGHAPREAILLLLASREIAARFDAAHGRPPDENDVEELNDIYVALEARAKAS